MSDTPIHILGILGSLRKESYNRMALRTCHSLLPENATLEDFHLDAIPPFNQDLEDPPPPEVAKFKDAVRKADAILFVSPEYNYSIPGVVKNAIDWGSRPPKDNVWSGKLAAMMGASMGMLGTGRGQYHLRQVFINLNVHTLNRPEVMIALAQNKFDPQGNLTDEPTREQIRKLLAALVDLARKEKKA